MNLILSIMAHGVMQMDNNGLLKREDSFLSGDESDTGIPRITFTVDISRIKDLPMLYKLIDKLKDDEKRFINYNICGDADG